MAEAGKARGKGGGGATGQDTATRKRHAALLFVGDPAVLAGAYFSLLKVE
jgi:hypothetical protein